MSSHPKDEPAHRLTVAPDDAGQRLDKFLSAHLAPLSRSRIKTLIEGGHVALADGQARQTIAEADRAVKPGESYVVTIPPAPEPTVAAQQIPLDIVFEDDDLIVVNKPAGLVVHPAAGNPDNTLVNALMAHCGPGLAGVGGARRPGIVHRLDKDTSGLMVAAKTEAAYQGLVELFSRHDIERLYEAVVWGVPMPPKASIDAPIGRHPRDRKKMAVSPKGKRAVTHYQVKAAFGTVAAHVECRLETGRTHQIRVHLASIGHPIIGDKTYARARGARRERLAAMGIDLAKLMPRQALHAGVLGFVHPVTGRPLHFRREPPSDILRLIEALARGTGAKPADRARARGARPQEEG